METQELLNRLTSLSAEYSTLQREMGSLKKNRAVEWLNMRKICSTDKECDNFYNATEKGQRELEVYYTIKGLEKEIGAVKAFIFN